MNTCKIPPARLGWMAGVLEMKGRLRVYDTKTRRNPLYKLVVESHHVDTVQRLAKMTGSKFEQTDETVIEQPADRRGCVEHCPEPHVHAVTRKLPMLGKWHMTGAAAAIVLRNLDPYFTPDDGERAKFVQGVFDCVPWSGRGRAAVDRSIARMQAHGWEIPQELYG